MPPLSVRRKSPVRQRGSSAMSQSVHFMPHRGRFDERFATPIVSLRPHGMLGHHNTLPGACRPQEVQYRAEDMWSICVAEERKSPADGCVTHRRRARVRSCLDPREHAGAAHRAKG
jgi:hypothetical protein